jgi:hypothetical protein
MANHFLFPGPYVISHYFDDYLVILNFVNGNYYLLNTEASKLIKLAEMGIFTKQLLKELVDSNPAKYSFLEVFFDILIKEEILIIENQDVQHTSSYETAVFEILDSNFNRPEIQVFNDMQHVLKLDDIFTVDTKGWPATDG